MRRKEKNVGTVLFDDIMLDNLEEIHSDIIQMLEVVCTPLPSYEWSDLFDKQKRKEIAQAVCNYLNQAQEMDSSIKIIQLALLSCLLDIIDLIRSYPVKKTKKKREADQIFDLGMKFCCASLALKCIIGFHETDEWLAASLDDVKIN